MKILLNQHLSWKLKQILIELFDDVKHVKDLNYTQADDLKIKYSLLKSPTNKGINGGIILKFQFFFVNFVFRLLKHYCHKP
jgi:hypothetical protein